MTNQSPDPHDEVIKMAEASLREAVGRLGNQHPEVLKMLEQFVGILRQCGRTELAERMAVRANALRNLLAEQGKLPLQAKTAGPPATTQAPPTQPAASQKEQKAEPAGAVERAKAAADAGVYDLDGSDDNEEEAVAHAVEMVKEQAVRSKAAAAPAPVAQPADTSSSTAPSPAGETSIFLFNSKGINVAVAYKGGLFTPEGKVVGRYLEDFDVFVDLRGWYLGQIVDGNRLTKDLTWRHQDLCFGNRGNEGDCVGWGRCHDVGRTFFERGFEDVKLSEDD
jgi:hypothetical protein